METNSLIKGLLSQHAPVLAPAGDEGAAVMATGACTSGEHMFTPRGSGCLQAQAITHTGDSGLCKQLFLMTCILRRTRRRKDTVRFCPVVMEIKRGEVPGEEGSHLCGSWERRCLAPGTAGCPTPIPLGRMAWAGGKDTRLAASVRRTF